MKWPVCTVYSWWLIISSDRLKTVHWPNTTCIPWVLRPQKFVLQAFFFPLVRVGRKNGCPLCAQYALWRIKSETLPVSDWPLNSLSATMGVQQFTCFCQRGCLTGSARPFSSPMSLKECRTLLAWKAIALGVLQSMLLSSGVLVSVIHDIWLLAFSFIVYQKWVDRGVIFLICSFYPCHLLLIAFYTDLC